VADAGASFTKMVCGYITNKLGHRKALGGDQEALVGALVDASATRRSSAVAGCARPGDARVAAIPG
jgi:hypothetical protein